MVKAKNIVYVCKKCHSSHSLKEFIESRFCRNCGTFLTSSDKKILSNEKKLVQKSSLVNVDSTLKETYAELVHTLCHSVKLDSLNVVNEVDKYRQFWKPEKTNVILLAESHVYTSQKDFSVKLNQKFLENHLEQYPTNFVRFVYCLGYGETQLLTKSLNDKRNSGTPQYWKIFSSCVAENDEDLGFDGILKTQTNFYGRIENKINVLNKMKKKGVWLLDASIVGLYGSGRKDYKTTEHVLKICWKNYISNLIDEVNPKHIIVIGKGVGNALRFYLRRENYDFTVIPQPQARGSSDWQLENFRNYQRICSKFC